MIVSFFTIYGYIIELLLTTTIFVHSLNRRNKFLFRLAATISAMFIFAICWKTFVDVTVISVILRHTILSLMLMLGIRFCFNYGIWASVYLGTASWTIQHAAYRIGYFLRSYYTAHVNETTGITIYIATVGFVYLLAFILVGNRMKDEDSLNMGSSNRQILLTAATLILFASVFQNAFEFLIHQNDFWFLFTMTCYDLVSCFLVLSIMFSILRSSKLYHEARLLEHVLNMQKEQLANSKTNIDNLNVKYHDLKYLVSSLNTKVSNDDLESLNKAISTYDLYLKTGNDALDVVLAEKRILCEQLNIKVNCIADGEKLNFIPPSEVYSLFGNAIDNAIEAVRFVDSPEKRVINISVKESMGLISIIVENYFIGNLIFEDNLPVTTKENKLFHGFGMKSIRMVVEKHSGYMTVKADNGKFILSVLLEND